MKGPFVLFVFSLSLYGPLERHHTETHPPSLKQPEISKFVLDLFITFPPSLLKSNSFVLSIFGVFTFRYSTRLSTIPTSTTLDTL